MAVTAISVHRQLFGLLPGLLLLAAVGYAGKFTEQSINAYGKAHQFTLPNIEYVLWAILFGLIVSNTIGVAKIFRANHFDRSHILCQLRRDNGAATQFLSLGVLSLVSEATGPGVYIGPVPSKASADAVVEALESVFPLRRCTVRLGHAFKPQPAAVPSVWGSGGPARWWCRRLRRASGVRERCPRTRWPPMAT